MVQAYFRSGGVLVIANEVYFAGGVHFFLAFCIAVVLGLQRGRSLRRYLGALDSLAGSSPRGASMNIEYVIGAIGSVVTFIVAIGVFSYYEIEKIAQQEAKNKSGN